MDFFNSMFVGFTISVISFTVMKEALRIIGLPQLGFL